MGIPQILKTYYFSSAPSLLFPSEYLLKQTDEMKSADPFSSNSPYQNLSVPAQPPESTLLQRPLRLTDLHGSSSVTNSFYAQTDVVIFGRPPVRSPAAPTPTSTSLSLAVPPGRSPTAPTPTPTSPTAPTSTPTSSSSAGPPTGASSSPRQCPQQDNTRILQSPQPIVQNRDIKIPAVQPLLCLNTIHEGLSTEDRSTSSLAKCPYGLNLSSSSYAHANITVSSSPPARSATAPTPTSTSPSSAGPLARSAAAPTPTKTSPSS